jgi:3-methyladenine DNA glycosylase AlkD
MMMTLHPYTHSLKTYFEQHADPGQAGPMAAYMRNQFEYLGIKTPQRTALLQALLAEKGLPPLAELDTILRELWHLPQREFQYLAVALLGQFARQLPPEFIETMEDLIVTKSWWDTVDSLSGPVGIHFQRYPEVKAGWLIKWRQSENLWLRRVTILFQLGYKKETDFPLLCEIIRENRGSNEFFINKAIGWALRQHSRVDALAVRTFVASTPLHPLSAREALKWLERRK